MSSVPPPPLYIFQRGEPIVIGRQVISGDPAGYAVAALLKKSAGQIVPPASAPAVATFGVSFAAASGQDPARWLLTIPADQTATLAPGFYAVDARFSIAGEVVEVTGPAFVRIVESVSG